jgi:hypothetical protein
MWRLCGPLLPRSGVSRRWVGRGSVAWEIRHRVVLPEPYRTFVAEIADGCSPELSADEGPLLPLGRLPGSWHSWDSARIHRLIISGLLSCLWTVGR